MLKMDEEKTRAALFEALSNYPDDGDPSQQEYVALMRRSARVQTEIAIFCMQEIERDVENPEQGFERIGVVLGNATFSQMMSIKDARDPESTQPTHDMIHVMCDAISKILHAHYYQISEAPPEEQEKFLHKIEVSRREVGDA